MLVIISQYELHNINGVTIPVIQRILFIYLNVYAAWPMLVKRHFLGRALPFS